VYIQNALEEDLVLGYMSCVLYSIIWKPHKLVIGLLLHDRSVALILSLKCKHVSHGHSETGHAHTPVPTGRECLLHTRAEEGLCFLWRAIWSMCHSCCWLTFLTTKVGPACRIWLQVWGLHSTSCHPHSFRCGCGSTDMIRKLCTEVVAVVVTSVLSSSLSKGVVFLLLLLSRQLTNLILKVYTTR
jgi:hypothetical protein